VRFIYSRAEGRLWVVWRLLLQYLLLLGLLFLAALGLNALSGNGWRIFDNAFVRGEVTTALAITLSVWLARRYLDRRKFSTLGLAVRRRLPVDLLVGFGLAGFGFILVFLLEKNRGWLAVQSYAWFSRSWPVISSNLLVWLVIYALIAWQEELLYRGYQLVNLTEAFGVWPGVILSSIIFSYVHRLADSHTWLAYLTLFLVGAVLAWVRLRTGSLWLPIGLHLGWNFFEGSVFGFPVSSHPGFALVHQTPAGASYITGGAYGPEAGLIVLLPLAIILIGVYGYTKVLR
jgi:membrane protease YdiL (CAAX protease family)